jgi:hypothetical protein
MERNGGIAFGLSKKITYIYVGNVESINKRLYLKRVLKMKSTGSKILALLSMLLLASCAQQRIIYLPGEVVTTYACDSECVVAVIFESGVWTLGQIDEPVEVGDTIYKECYYKNQTTLGCSSNFVMEKE